MAAPAPPRSDFAVLDRLIVEALSELRSARRGAARTGDHKNLERQARAEEHLDALLDYRYCARRRDAATPDVPGATPELRSGPFGASSAVAAPARPPGQRT
jgi:hypothetical protein